VVPAEPTDDAQAAVDELFPQGRERLEYLLRFAALIVLSSSIAAFGLLSDSAAVVIGAMLVAPLMTPILATAAATVRALNRELVIALAVIGMGTALAIAVGYVMSFIASDTIVGSTELPGEVKARTFPGLLDLGVAVSAGAAGGYILPRRAATGALPGVGIAVALVPPLAVVGITWEAGATSDSWGALLLFVTNLAAIVFAAAVMLLFAGFRPRLRRSRVRLLSRVAITFGAVLAVAVPLTLHTRATLEDGRLRRIVARTIVDWDPSARVVDLNAEVRGGTAHVEVFVAGPSDPEEVWALVQDAQSRFGGPMEFELRYAQDRRFQVSIR
jgi:uncharacterized hydrophobic protein (TIGR00271 family)